MRYFRGNFRDMTDACQEVWKRQDAAQAPRSMFSSSAVGLDTSVWTESPEGEKLFREILQERDVEFEEGDTQQVRTFLDGPF